MLTRPAARTRVSSAARHSWFGLLSSRLGLPEPVVTTVRRELGLRAVMDDGVELLADRWVPQGVVDPPLLLVRSPYGRGGIQAFSNARVFAHQGFQVVIQSCRGTDGSGGDFSRPLVQEEADGGATVRWLQQQSWYPGGFGTIGASYLGYTQLSLAEAAGDALKAMVLQVTPCSPRDVAWPGDALGWHASLSWAVSAQRGAAAVLRNALALRSTERNVRLTGMTGPLRESYLAASKGRIGFLEDWITNPNADDPFWATVDRRPALEAITCPVLVQGGWYDLLLQSSFEQYERLHARGVPVELSVGPWTHAGFGTKGIGSTLTEAAGFLRETLGATPRPRPLAPVRFVELGSNRPVNLEAWPPPQEERSLSLVGGGRLAPEPDDDGQTRYTYDPGDPTPHAGGATLELKAGVKDNAALESRADVLCFDTGPLERDWHLLGPVEVSLTFGSDRPSTSVFLRVCDAAPSGVSTNLTDRMVRLTAATRGPDGTWAVRTQLPPTCALVPAGHRLRLQVSSGAFPWFARDSGTDEPPASASTYEIAHQVVNHRGATVVFHLAQ